VDEGRRRVFHGEQDHGFVGGPFPLPGGLAIGAVRAVALALADFQRAAANVTGLVHRSFLRLGLVGGTRSLSNPFASLFVSAGDSAMAHAGWPGLLSFDPQGSDRPRCSAPSCQRASVISDDTTNIAEASVNRS